MIALDIDGVVADSLALLRTIIRYSYGIDISNYITCYTIPKLFPMMDFGVFFEDCMLNFCHAVEPYPDAKIACNLLLEKTSFPLLFVTARRFALKDLTIDWINKRLELPKDNFSVILKSSFKKKEYIEKSGISHFVEDRLRTANEIATIPSVKKSYLINRKWNIGRDTHPKVVRKDTLLECIKDYLKLT